MIGRGCQALLAHVLHDTDPRTWAGGLGAGIDPAHPVKTGKVSILRIDGAAVLHSERSKMSIRREVTTPAGPCHQPSARP